MSEIQGEGAMDIFNLQSDSFINPPKQQNNVLYKPDADKGREGVYKSLIRFLPWHKNPNNSKIKKIYVWVDDPVDGPFSVDCPSTVGKKSVLRDTYWKLKNSQSAADQEKAQKFARAENYYSLVQIIQDKNNPELEGKIMVFKFGKKIDEKIEAQLKPAYGTSCNPYDLFEGKVFAVHVTKKQKWNNYDLCEFVGDKCAFKLPNREEPIKRTKEDMEAVLNFLKESSPDLGAYEYREWTDETHDKVAKAIANILPGSRLTDDLLKDSAETRPVSSKPATSQNIDDLMGGYDSTPEPKKDQPKKEAAPKKASSLDDLYEGL